MLDKFTFHAISVTYGIQPCRLDAIFQKFTMAKTLTATEVEKSKLPEGKTELELYDGNNLILRLRKRTTKVAKSWLFRYTSPVSGKRRKLALGNYPSVTLAEARELAREREKLLTSGLDPQIERANIEAEALATSVAVEHGEIPTTVRDLFDRWDTDYLQHHHSDQGAYVRRLFNKHVLNQQFADLRLDLVKKPHTIVVLNNIRAKGVTRTCGIALTSMRQMFSFGIDHEWLIGDPTRGLEPKTWKGQSREVDRFLEEDELRDLYKRLYKGKFPVRWQAAIWFITAMGSRMEETMLAEKSHFDFEKQIWLIPKGNQKKLNNVPAKDRTLYLSDFAVACAKFLVSIAGDSKYVFPSERRNGEKDKPAAPSTLTKLIRDRQRTSAIKGRRAVPLELLLRGGNWTPHDLRRTMSTHMQELGISPDIIDKCQAHAIENSVRRIYQRAELKSLMADAWQSWGQQIQGLLAHAHAELKAELARESQAHPEDAKLLKPLQKQRSVRAGRGPLGEPLLDMLAPFTTDEGET